MTLPERANQAMANALGEWLLFLGDGDSLEPNHIAELIATASTSDLTQCICAGVHLGCGPLETSPKEHVWRLAPEPRVPHSYASMPLCAGLFARSLFEEGCRFDTQLDNAMAIWEFWLQLACKGTWVANPGVTARHCDRDRVQAEDKPCSPPGRTSPLRVIDSWLSHCPPAAVAETLWEECSNASVLGESKALHLKLSALGSALKIKHGTERDLRNALIASEAQLTSSQHWAVECENLCQDLRREVESLKNSTSLTLRHKIRKLLMAFRRADT